MNEMEFEISTKFGDRLKELRNEKKIKQDSLSEYLLNLGVDGSTALISKWENNRAVPTLTQLTILADYFNVSIDYLTGRTDQRQVYELSDILDLIKELVLAVDDIKRTPHVYKADTDNINENDNLSYNAIAGILSKVDIRKFMGLS